MDFPGRLIAGLLVVVLILIFPLQYIASLNNESIDALVDERTHLFSNSIREKGFIDKQMYEEYASFLDTTGERYELDLQDIRPVKGEDIGIAKENKKSGVKALRTTFDNNTIPTLISINEIQSFAAHTHTEACYAGHRHNSSCSGMALTFIITYVSEPNWLLDSVTIYCGFCQKHILSISRGSGEYTPLNMTVKVGNRSNTYYQHLDPANYSKYYNDLNQLKTKLTPYVYDTRARDYGYAKYGNVYPTDFTFDLPILGKITNCETPDSPACSGKPYPYILRGGYDSYYGQYNYYIDCNYCKKVIAKINYYPWKESSTAYLLTIYNINGSVKETNSNSSVVGPIFWAIDKHRIELEQVNVILAVDDPILNYSVMNSVKSHGCIYPESCSLPEDNTPICNKVVTAITATKPSQTVKKGEAIITTATATYLDGHIGTVSCTSNYNPNILGTQKVTLTYTGLVGNAKTTGTRTCTIDITVLPVRNLKSITVLPDYQSIQRYSMPSFTVRANYDDGTSRVLGSSEYNISGFNGASIGLQSLVVTYAEGGITKAATVRVEVTALMKECPRCNQIYELNPDDTDPGCPYCRELIVGIEVKPNYVEVTKGDILPITVMGIYNNGTKGQVAGWISNFNSERVGLQIVTVQYQGYAADITVWVNEGLNICPICETRYPASEDSCPVCSDKVIRIDVLPKEITIKQFETIPLTVTAYYADGSSKVVDNWTTDRTSVTPGTFIATVSYKGVSDTLELTVLSINSTSCPICHTIYDLSVSPKGCPICSEEIIGIEAYLTSGTNLVQLGATPAIAVILIFRDEHREFAQDSYELENFNPRELGIQTVRVLYKGFATTIIVKVVNRLDAITCPNGHMYYKNNDGTDSGCTFCHEDDDISKIAYFDITYTREILDTLYSMGVYHFQKGNYISVLVTKKDKSLLYRLQNTFFSTSMLGRKKRFIYGGEVNHE